MLDNSRDIISKEKILEALKPIHAKVTIIDNSHLHENHFHGTKNGFTHIKLIIEKTSFFDELSNVQAHQKVYILLKKLINNGLHAIELKIGD